MTPLGTVTMNCSCTRACDINKRNGGGGGGGGEDLHFKCIRLWHHGQSERCGDVPPAIDVIAPSPELYNLNIIMLLRGEYPDDFTKERRRLTSCRRRC